MLVSVNVVNGGLLGERRDSAASALVQSTYQTADRRTKASKFLIDRKHSAVKRVIASSQRVREVVYRFTFPWGNDTMRGLTTKLSDEFKSELGSAITDRQKAIEEYLIHYPSLVANSENDLGSLFDASQYPGVDRVRDLFRCKVNYWPMPESGHFIADVSAETAKEVKREIEHEIEERLIEATYDMVKRAKVVVAAFVDKLEAFKLDDKGKPDIIFRDSLVNNIRDTANLIDRMNLTGNAQVNKIIKDLQRLTDNIDLMLLRSPNHGEQHRLKALTTGQEILINLTMLDLKDQEVSDMVSDTSDYMDM